mmetsp:Transcript_4254/g.27156  ORF Transcript_4254/g.27156 Transcript_4254/m.27156 type:complete len:329 (-) Transcript_4254:154-1140(-)
MHGQAKLCQFQSNAPRGVVHLSSGDSPRMFSGSRADVRLIDLSNKNAFSHSIILIECPGATSSHCHDSSVLIEADGRERNWVPFGLKEFLPLLSLPYGEAPIPSSRNKSVVVSWMMGHGLHRMHDHFSPFVLAVAFEGVLFGLDPFVWIRELDGHAPIHGRHDEAFRILGDADGSCLGSKGRFSSLPWFVGFSQIEEGHFSPGASHHQHVFFRVHGIHFVRELHSCYGFFVFRFSQVPQQDIFVPSTGEEQVPFFYESHASRPCVVYAEQPSICTDHVVAPDRSVRTHASHFLRSAIDVAASQPRRLVFGHTFGQATCVAHGQSAVPE